ncbi:zinc knuckle CX2CX4HX4C [Artemisia annua]|uniref:Zinc knuckle CX2CX4HX4C n=1 Tax=Artemisia annua TaxID=35608 RepID=A0A2U1KGI8_ARTAN|nr:zinc knuckle CX2CX4HX4C [Artemisia annua]
MSEQEPKPPNPNESIPPPPVVNPPSSSSDKNLKTKKTTRTMNPKPTNTMKHHEMLNKSTDVNFKKVMTRSSSKGSDAGMGSEEMECEDEVNEARLEKGVPVESGEAIKSMNGVVSGDIRSKEVLVTSGLENVAVKEVNKRKGVSSDEVNGNVSDMFPELSSTNLSKKSNDIVDIMPDIPVPIELNPLLNPMLNSGESSKVNSIESNVSKGGSLGKENTVGGDNTKVQGMNGNNGDVGETSGTRNVEMQENIKTRKPMLFSNVVKGASYVGGYGRASYARVLVEVDAAKGLADAVEIWYRKLNRSMKLKVEYAWQPPICSHCCVFGHCLEECSHRVLTEKEKIITKVQNPQAKVNTNDVQKNVEGWKSVDYGKTNRNYGEQKSDVGPGVHQNQPYNSYGVGNNRGGMYMGRGGPGFRGRGGFNGRGDDGGEEKKNEWQEVKVNIDVACEMGIPFDENEVIKWPHELQKYYIEKCAAMKNRDKRDLLINKIRIFEGDINCSRANIEQFAHKEANEGVVFEMENSGTNREQAFGVVYDDAYRREMDRIQEVVFKKQLAEVELFIFSGKPFSDAVKEGWTDVMIDFYKDRMTQNGKDKNNVNNLEDEMGNDNSAQDDFIAQNIVSNAVDTAMADMLGNENAVVACGNVNGYEALTAGDDLKSRIDKLQKNIVLSVKNLHGNVKKIAEQRIIDECDGKRVQSSYNLFYSQAYEVELKNIKQMKWQKDMLEVDLFVNSGQSLNENIKVLWSNEMVKYYENVCDERKNDTTNGHGCEYEETSNAGY